MVGVFLSDNSVLRLWILLAVDTNTKWLDHKYVSWDNLVQSKNTEEGFIENFDVVYVNRLIQKYLEKRTLQKSQNEKSLLYKKIITGLEKCLILEHLMRYFAKNLPRK